MTPTPTPEIISNGTYPDHGITKEFLEKALKEEALMNGTSTPSILSFKVEEGSKPGDNYLVKTEIASKGFQFVISYL